MDSLKRNLFSKQLSNVVFQYCQKHLRHKHLKIEGLLGIVVDYNKVLLINVNQEQSASSNQKRIHGSTSAAMQSVKGHGGQQNPVSRSKPATQEYAKNSTLAKQNQFTENENNPGKGNSSQRNPVLPSKPETQECQKNMDLTTQNEIPEENDNNPGKGHCSQGNPVSPSKPETQECAKDADLAAQIEIQTEKESLINENKCAMLHIHPLDAPGQVMPCMPTCKATDATSLSDDNHSDKMTLASAVTVQRESKARQDSRNIFETMEYESFAVVNSNENQRGKKSEDFTMKKTSFENTKNQSGSVSACSENNKHAKLTVASSKQNKKESKTITKNKARRPENVGEFVTTASGHSPVETGKEARNIGVCYFLTGTCDVHNISPRVINLSNVNAIDIAANVDCINEIINSGTSTSDTQQKAINSSDCILQASPATNPREKNSKTEAAQRSPVLGKRKHNKDEDTLHEEDSEKMKRSINDTWPTTRELLNSRRSTVGITNDISNNFISQENVSAQYKTKNYETSYVIGSNNAAFRNVSTDNLGHVENVIENNVADNVTSNNKNISGNIIKNNSILFGNADASSYTINIVSQVGNIISNHDRDKPNKKTARDKPNTKTAEITVNVINDKEGATGTAKETSEDVTSSKEHASGNVITTKEGAINGVSENLSKKGRKTSRKPRNPKSLSAIVQDLYQNSHTPDAQTSNPIVKKNYKSKVKYDGDKFNDKSTNNTLKLHNSAKSFDNLKPGEDEKVIKRENIVSSPTPIVIEPTYLPDVSDCLTSPPGGSRYNTNSNYDILNSNKHDHPNTFVPRLSSSWIKMMEETVEAKNRRIQTEATRGAADCQKTAVPYTSVQVRNQQEGH